jgi:hypothetical protein
MGSLINRRTLVRRTAGAALGTAAATATTGDVSSAAVTLDAQYTSPFPPHPTIAYPSSWYAFTGLTEVSIPAGVYVSDERLAPVKDVSGLPDLRLLPTTVTLLGLFHQWFPSEAAVSTVPVLQLTGPTMRFSDLHGGNIIKAGFRKFANAYVVNRQGNTYGLQVMVWIGPDAGSEWQIAQQIVDSISV